MQLGEKALAQRRHEILVLTSSAQNKNLWKDSNGATKLRGMSLDSVQLSKARPSISSSPVLQWPSGAIFRLTLSWVIAYRLDRFPDSAKSCLIFLLMSTGIEPYSAEVPSGARYTCEHQDSL